MIGSMARLWLLLLALVAAIYGSLLAWRNYRDGGGAPHPADAPPVASAAQKLLFSGELPQFTLTDQTGQPFAGESLRGKVWVANYFFTSCPSRCRRTCELLAQLHRSPEGSTIDVVSFTCDPDNDRPSVLGQYAESLRADQARWHFLTGEMPRLQQIGRDYFKAGVARGEHSDRCYVIGHDGKIRDSFYVTEEGQYERMARLVAKLVAEGGRAAN